jgi:hypothetical protein
MMLAEIHISSVNSLVCWQWKGALKQALFIFYFSARDSLHTTSQEAGSGHRLHWKTVSYDQEHPHLSVKASQSTLSRRKEFCEFMQHTQSSNLDITQVSCPVFSMLIT